MLPKQNLPWWRHDRPWGFRFSVMDAVIIVAGLAITAVLWPDFGLLTLLIPFLLTHFFLFCNTFRVGGERSLVWCFTLVLNACWAFQTQTLLTPLILQDAITLTLIINCVCGKNYHGLACELMNPKRFRTGASTEGAFTRKVLLAMKLPKPVIEVLIGRKLDEFYSNQDSSE